MDERLKQLMQKLGQAINESLSESEEIAEIIGEIRNEDYDVFLILEATIGLNKREDEEDLPVEPELRSKLRSLDFSEQDQAFLNALKITVED